VFQCALDAAAFAACTSPQAYSSLAAGTHTFQVRAVDSGGNADPTPATRSWTVQSQQPAGDPMLLAAGDVAYCPGAPSASGSAQTAQILGQYPNATIAVLGDAQYNNATLAEYQACFDKTWGAYKSRIRPAAGAHDYFTGSPDGYFSYFGAAAGTPNQGWYSYDLGSWHVVVLNAPACESSCPTNGAQMQWLQSDLAAHPAKCTLAYFAYPLFDSGTGEGPDPNMKPFWTALYNAGADVVLNGDEHLYERFAPQSPSGAADSAKGIREFLVGTGGRNLYSFGKAAANSQVRYNGSYGVLQMTLHAGSYDWTFLPVAGATFTDSGTGTCH